MLDARSLVMALALAGCSEAAAPADASSRVDTGVRDASALDAGDVDAGDIDAGTDPGIDASTTTDAGTEPDLDGGGPDAAVADGGAALDARVEDASGPRIFDVRVRADAACSDLFFEPASISVPAGSTFTVRWINATGCTEIDIDKDGTVPIVLGLEPGSSYHDTIREWCGSFTGTFFFRAYYAPSFPYFLDVDCSG